MPELLQNPLFALLPVTFLALMLLYIREYNLRRKYQSSGDQFIKQIKEKGWETLNQSIRKSQAIVGEAELAGIKVMAQTNLSSARTEHEHQAKLTEMLNQSRQTIASSQQALIDFMSDLQKRAVDFESASQNATQQRINQLFERMEQKLSDFLISTEQKTISSIDLELKGTRELIETYRIQQFKLIDENILAMMEQTLNTVLAKKLSLKDQLELIYEALEKAKAEKIIV